MKGQSRLIISLIVALGVIIILILLFKQLKPYIIDNGTEHKNCKLQVSIHAFKENTTKGEVSTPIDCPTDIIVIPKNDNKEEAFNKIADEMITCWDEWGRGKYMLYDKEGIYCHVCGVISFEDKEGVLSGWNDFLSKNEIPRIKQTMLSYLMPGIQGDLFTGKSMAPSDAGIDKSKDYAVIFYYLRGEEVFKTWLGNIEKNTIVSAEAHTGAFLAGSAVGAGAGMLLFCTAGLLLGGAPGFLCYAGVLGSAAAVGTISTMTLGSAASYYYEHPPAYASFLLVRPYDAENIKDLGCQYSYAKMR